MEDEIDFLIEVLNRKNSELANMKSIQDKQTMKVSNKIITKNDKIKKFIEDDSVDSVDKKYDELKAKNIKKAYISSNIAYITNHKKKPRSSKSLQHREEDKVLYNLKNENETKDKVL